MIGASSMGTGFGALGNYLAGDDRRVEWVETRNMAEGRDWGGGGPVDWREVVAEMEDTAQGRSLERPMYHVSIAFDPTDDPTDAEVRWSVDRTLRDLGLDKHQAFVVRHNDTDHAHVHIMVNRVGEDGAVWSPWRDRVKLRASMEAQERELGVRYTGKNRGLTQTAERAPDRAPDRASIGGTSDRAPEPAPPPRPAEKAPRDGRGFAAEVRGAALRDLKEAPSWADLDRRLEAHGWRIERRGQGAVITDDTREVKLSSVSRSVTRSKLERRLGPLRAHERGGKPEQGHAPERAPVRGPQRDVGGRGAGHPTARSAGRGPKVTVPRPPSPSIKARGGSRTTPGYGTAPGAVRGAGYSFARAAPSAAAVKGHAHGAARAVTAESADTDPGRPALSAARGVARVAGPAGRALAARGVARVAGPAGRALAGRSLASRSVQARAVHRDLGPNGRVDKLVGLVKERVGLARLDESYRGVLGAHSLVSAHRVGVARRAGVQEKGAKAAFARALGEVYHEPGRAYDAFNEEARARVHGAEAAVKTMAERPEAFGTLRATEDRRAFGLRRGWTDGPARAAAPEAARLGRTHLVAVQRSAEADLGYEAVDLERSGGRRGRSPRAQAVLEGGDPGVRALTVRAERAEAALYPRENGVVRGRERELDERIGALHDRIGRVGPSKGARAPSQTPGARGAAAVGGPPAPGRSGRDAGRAASVPTGREASRVRKAVQARVSVPGVRAVVRAVKAAVRGLGRE